MRLRSGWAAVRCTGVRTSVQERVQERVQGVYAGCVCGGVQETRRAASDPLHADRLLAPRPCRLSVCAYASPRRCTPRRLCVCISLVSSYIHTRKSHWMTRSTYMKTTLTRLPTSNHTHVHTQTYRGIAHVHCTCLNRHASFPRQLSFEVERLAATEQPAAAAALASASDILADQGKHIIWVCGG